MSRKKTTVTPEDHTESANIEVIEADAACLDKLNQHQNDVIKKYGDGMPYDEQRLDGVIYNRTDQLVESYFHIGQALILHKEFLSHGRFLEKINNDYRFSPRRAREMMLVARKFAGANGRTSAHLGVSKLLLIADESDESIDEFVKGGELAGVEHDDVSRMPFRELRTTLRKERKKHQADNTAHEKLLESKDKKINALSKKAHSVDEQTKDFIMQSASISSEAINLLTQLKTLRESYLAHEFGGDSEGEMHDIREEADNLMGPVFHHLVRQIASSAASLITETDFVFMKHKDQEMPDLDMWEEILDS